MKIVVTAMSLFSLAMVVVLGTIVTFAVRASDARSTRVANGPATALAIAGLRLPKGYYYDGVSEGTAGASAYVRPAGTRYPDFSIRVQASNSPLAAFALGSDDGSVDIQVFASPCARLGAKRTYVDPMRTASGQSLSLHAIVCAGRRGRDYTYEVARIPSTFPRTLITASGPSAAFDRAGLRALVASLP